MKTKHYQRLFKNDNGKKFGDLIEEVISRICDFSPGEIKCDRQFGSYRIECKAMRSVAEMDEKIDGDMPISKMVNRVEENTMESRALLSIPLIDGRKEWQLFGQHPETNKVVYVGDSCFCQQTKPANFDYLVATNVFLDKMRVYIIPSKDIQPTVSRRGGGKISMAPQHGNDKEGVLTLAKVMDYHAFDVVSPLNKLGKLKVDITSNLSNLKRSA